MYTVELYARVRRAVQVEGKSERQVAREYGLARETVRKMLQYSIPPGYRRQQPAKRPKLDPWVGVIEAILQEDRERPRKQRHTAKRIHERLREEHGFGGGYTIVKDYVRLRELRQREMFVPLQHPPGDAQADFGEALAVIDGEERKAHYLAIDLPQSDDCFVMAFPAETTEAFLEGHNQAFVYFGGVPRTILYDNTKLAVARILGDGTRKKTQAFSELQSHYLFQERFGRPGKGNDKGKVEGLVGYARRTYLVPLPAVDSLTELNAFLARATAAEERRHRARQADTVGERFAAERPLLAPLPVRPFLPCTRHPVRASSQALVAFDGSRYSVPVRHAGAALWVRAYATTVEIWSATVIVASHPRATRKGTLSTDFCITCRHSCASRVRLPTRSRSARRSSRPSPRRSLRRSRRPMPTIGGLPTGSSSRSARPVPRSSPSAGGRPVPRPSPAMRSVPPESGRRSPAR